MAVRHDGRLELALLHGLTNWDVKPNWLKYADVKAAYLKSCELGFNIGPIDFNGLFAWNARTRAKFETRLGFKVLEPWGQDRRLRLLCLKLWPEKCPKLSNIGIFVVHKEIVERIRDMLSYCKMRGIDLSGICISRALSLLRT